MPTYEELCDLLLEIEESGADLSPKDARFITDTRNRVERYGEKTTVSPAQWDWLKDIHKRATGE